MEYGKDISGLPDLITLAWRYIWASLRHSAIGFTKSLSLAVGFLAIGCMGKISFISFNLSHFILCMVTIPR
jgi:hypothetical protein